MTNVRLKKEWMGHPAKTEKDLPKSLARRLEAQGVVKIIELNQKEPKQKDMKNAVKHRMLIRGNKTK